MKRFFCTVCKKVRRVRRLPVIVDTMAGNPFHTVGECDKHNAPRAPKVRVIKGTFSEANVQQAEGRFNRTGAKKVKVR